MSAQPQRHAGTEPRNGNGSAAPAADDASAEGVARRMASGDRALQTRPGAPARPAGSTASADAVEQLRRSITDIKHDIRMLKVVVDKQSIAIDRLVAAIEDLAGSEEE